MTGNAQVDHRKYVHYFYVDHRGGQFESLQSVPVVERAKAVIWMLIFLIGVLYRILFCLVAPLAKR